MSDDPHAVAILTALRDAPGLTVYPPPNLAPGAEMVPTGAAPPYLVAWIQVSYALGPTLDMTSSRAVVIATLHSVGATDTAARVVAGKGRAALLDVVLSIPGRRCWPVRYEDGQSPRPDESTGRLVVDQVDVYRLESLPG